MRLIQYINEGSNDIDTLLKNTKPWWDYCKKQGVKNKFLWRGNYRSKNIKSYKKLKVRKNREPTDTCEEFHEIADNFFYNIFGIRARSQTVFCFSDKKEASSYGSYRNVIIPIGKFNYIWSPIIEDFFSYIENEDFYFAICDKDNIYNNYDYDYGEESGNGTWYYDNKDTKTNDYYEAIEIVKENYEGISETEIEWDLKWVPFIDEDEYAIQVHERTKEEIYNLIKENYIKNKKFKHLMDNNEYNNNEIMLDCDYYYIINEDWAFKYLNPII